MSKSTRRSVLGLFGTAVLGTALPATGITARGLGIAPAAEDLRQALSRSRNRIKTIDIRFRTTASPSYRDDDWVRDGVNRLIFRQGAYKVTHTRGDVEFTEILVEGRYIQHARSLTGERPSETLYDGPVQGPWRLGTSLQQFLPVPRDLPVVDEGTDQHRGATCNRLLQGHQRFWVEQGNPRVVRLDVFADSSRLSEVVELGEFQEILPRLSFPMSVESRRFDSDGEENKTLAVQVTGVEVNEFIPADIFEIEE